MHLANSQLARDLTDTFSGDVISHLVHFEDLLCFLGGCRQEGVEILPGAFIQMKVLTQDPGPADQLAASPESSNRSA
jgi:hypothetical protein